MKQNGISLEPLVIIADVTVDAERIIFETIKRYGRLDILINNAGFALDGSLEKLKMHDFDAMMRTNVRAAIELSQLAIPHLAETKGNIVNVSSTAGITPIASFFAYSLSKAALDHFTMCAAMELAPKQIRVNSVNLGFIDTNHHSIASCVGRVNGDYDEVVEEIKLQHPLRRIGYTEDCVNAITFLAQESFISAILLRVDGM